MTSQFTNPRNAFSGKRAAGLLLSSLLLTGCGQPDTNVAADEAAADAAPPEAAVAPAEVADSVAGPDAKPVASEDKKSLFKAGEVAEATAAAATQSQQDRQAIIDEASAKTDARLKAAADSAAAADTP